jgi:SAM-dependent methyltransferase
LAAASKGYRVIGIDPWLDALRAARRVASQMELPIDYVCADARFLPFQRSLFSAVFSYGVFHHFDQQSFRASLEEMRRVLVPGGTCMVQLANRYGLRSLYQQCRRGWREARSFEVRYRSPEQLCKDFKETIGPARLSVDGYFGLNMQSADVDLLPLRYKLLVHFSEAIRKMSFWAPALVRAADSLYVQARRPVV